MGQDDPLRRAVREVSLMPEGDVLQRGRHERPHDPREGADVLGGDRVLLLGHRRAPDLFLRLERLRDLADFRALQVPDLGAELLQGRSEVREDGDEFGVPIAADDLRRRFFHADAEVAHDRGLNV